MDQEILERKQMMWRMIRVVVVVVGRTNIGWDDDDDDDPMMVTHMDLTMKTWAVALQSPRLVLLAQC